MKGSEFYFDYVHLLYCKCHETNPNCGGSYISSPDWIKNKQVTINHINKKDNKCFQYAVTVALSYEEIKKDAQIKIMEQLHLMFCMLKKRNIYPAYVSKHSSSSEKQVIPLMIPNGEGWHYLAVKNTSIIERNNIRK